MRALFLLLALAVPLLGCDMRSDAEKALEQRRIAYMQETNAKAGGPELQFLSGGKHHTSVVRVEKLGGNDEAETRETIEHLFKIYGNAADEFTGLGFTDVVIRDMVTGMEVTKSFREITPPPKSDEEKRLEYARDANANAGSTDTLYLTEGDGNTALVLVLRDLGNASAAERREQVDIALRVYSRDAPRLTAIGFTRLVIRDKDSGTEASRTLAEVSSQSEPRAQQ